MAPATLTRPSQVHTPTQASVSGKAVSAPGFARSGGINPVGAVTTTLGIASTVAGLTGFLGVAMEFIGDKIKPLKRVTEPVANVANLANVPAEDLVKETARVFSSDSPITQAVETTSSTIASLARKTLGDHHCNNLQKNSAGSLLMSSSMIIGGSVGLGNGLGSKLQAIQHIQQELTGEKPSILKIMMGSKDLHPVAQQARKELFSPPALFATAVEVASIAGGIHGLFSGKENGIASKVLNHMENNALTNRLPVSVRSMAVSLVCLKGQEAINNMARSATSDHVGCDSYVIAHKLSAAGKEIPQITYANLIAGLVPNVTSEGVAAVSKHCHEHQLPPKEALEAINTIFYEKSGHAQKEQQRRSAPQTSNRSMAMAG